MQKKLLALAAVPFFALAISGCAHPQPYYPPPPPAQIAQQGFHDGVDAARRDLANGLAPDISRHRRFRTPPVPPGQPVHDYRDGFRRGYNQTFRNATAR
ncbi:MAG TPA: hypothetical protein VHX63_08120 [Acidobacteriaceae bacterium]|nr:hypothetical protein [Acidobacteriaceae bacterium]